jgi:glucose/arabinose dehydrogenase
MIALAGKQTRPMNGPLPSGSTNTPMKNTLAIATLVLALFTSLAPAGTIKIPADKPAATVNIPDAWEPEVDEDGVLAESPDNVATLFLEIVADEKEMEAAIESSLEWLVKDHEVKVDADTKEEKDFEDAGRTWSRISWSAESKEWGPAVVGFLFSEVGDGKVLTITYWISKKDSEKSLETLGKIFSSVKNVE